MINGFETIKAKADAMFINFSDILRKGVIDSEGAFLGRVWDISLKFGDIYPKLDEVIIKSGLIRPLYAVMPWPNVKSLEDDIVLGIKKESVKFEPAPKEYDFLLKRDVLDQQVVDTYNHKVIRVNDIHLLKVDHEVMVAHVDIGLRGLFRRLGWEKAVDLLVEIIDKDAKYLKREELISWKYVQPVSINPASMTMKLSVSQKQLASIPAADLSEIMFDLNFNERIALFKALDTKTKAKIFENLEFEDQKAILKELDKNQAVEIITNMSSDEATDLLEKLPRNMVENILTLMESTRARKLSTLLGYSSNSAGGLMTTDYISITGNTSVEAAIEHIKNHTREFELAPYIYLVDEKNHLTGMTTVRRLLFADPKDAVSKTAFPKNLYIHLNAGVKEVAYFMDKYKLSAIPVVDENNILHGIITMDDILSQVISLAWRKKPYKAKKL